uniref:RRM domain-containing protein n=1 Tax=Aegilops tauschii subsp. strangulata TaxID=200361 RepID=A0A453ANT7_AEGTS
QLSCLLISLAQCIFCQLKFGCKDAFSQHGDVTQVKVICHPVTGRSKGYGFVKLSSDSEAAVALEKMSADCRGR